MVDQGPRRDLADVLPQPFEMFEFVQRLFPLNRSLTGDGNRETLKAIAEHVPLTITEVPSGSPVLDWFVPQEWTVRSATLKSLDGLTLVDFAENNLHLLGYSQPFSGLISREDLASRIYTIPEQPDLVPYRTGYFAESWGFCLSQNQWDSMTESHYIVEIDSDVASGSLSYGEFYLPGRSPDDILLTVHICHPSLANDNLSGIAVAVGLALSEMKRSSRHLGLRILFAPATIGAITWLSRNEETLGRIGFGLVLSCLGDEGVFHYKRSRSPSYADRLVEHVLNNEGFDFEVLPFSPYGYDERQFCSPGYDLPVGCLMRSVHGTFPEYHTSADNLAFVTPAALKQSAQLLRSVIDTAEQNRSYRRVDGRGEPQLGRRGLYRAIAGQSDGGGASQLDLLWFLNLADGSHDVLAIAERAGVPTKRIIAAAQLAIEAGLVEERT